MTEKELKIQRALGTLPFKEWMKLKGIILKNKWWYFPILKEVRRRDSKSFAIINNIKHYPVHDEYIDDLQYSMAWNNWSEEEFAKEVIATCYECMSLETIDF